MQLPKSCCLYMSSRMKYIIILFYYTFLLYFFIILLYYTFIIIKYIINTCIVLVSANINYKIILVITLYHTHIMLYIYTILPHRTFLLVMLSKPSLYFSALGSSSGHFPRYSSLICSSSNDVAS